LHSHFLNTLTNIDPIEGKWFRCNNPLAFYSAKYDLTICSPPGFVTDFASVPRLPLVYLLTGNTGHWEALIHDTMYRFFYERIMADLIFYESGIVRSNMRENQHWLYQYGRYTRTTLMTGGVLLLGWTTHNPLQGCLDYRKKKTCGQKCETCNLYYPYWFLCKMNGYHPEILELHEAV
jgi:hypothetical protein